MKNNLLRAKLNEKFLTAFVSTCNSSTKKIAASVIYVASMSVIVQHSFAEGNILANGTDLIQKLANALRNLSHPAALIGVACGAFLKKFSLGKMDRIETGNKLIVNSLWGWLMINGIGAILNWAGGGIGKENGFVENFGGNK